MDFGEADESLSRFLSDLESLSTDDPFPEPSLLDLQFLISSSSSDAAAAATAFTEDAAFPLWPRLAANGISTSSLLRPLSAAMDLPSPTSSLLAARAYLSLLLTPAAPVLSLFSPLAFISLLRSLRQALKPLPSMPSPVRRMKRKPVRNRTEDQRCGAAGDTLIDLLGLLDSVLSRVRLDSSPDGVKSLVDTVAAILSSGAADYNRLSTICFRILFSAISRPEHGVQTDTTVEVLKSLASMVLSSPPKSALRAAALGFVTRKIAPLARENLQVRKAFIYFPRYLISKAPERADPRAAAVEAILEVVRVLEKEDQIGFSEYVVKMTQGETHLRLLAVDLILSLLISLPDPLGVDESLETAGCWGMKCLNALLLRCSDSMGGVRARALTNMAQVIEFLSGDATNSARLQEGMASGDMNFSELLRKRCLDEKAAVRKAALSLITRSTALIGRPIQEVVLKTIGSACMDPLVSIRKAAMSAISEVYRQLNYHRMASFCASPDCR